MTIRMSSLQYMYNYKTGLNRAYQKQAKLFEHADGNKIHRASDDAVAYSKLLRYNVSQVENDQYKKDVDTAMSFMKTEDRTIDQMVSIAKTFAEKTIQAANTYNTSADFESIAKEMYSCIEEIVSLTNTQQGDRYIFSGQRDTTEPFTMSEASYERGVPKTLDTAQIKFFKNITSASDANVYQMLALKDADGNEYCLDTESGYIYTKEFVEEGYKELMTLDYNYIEDAQSIDSDATRFDAVMEVLYNGTYCKLDSDNYLAVATTDEYGDPIEITDTNLFVVSDYFESNGVIKTEADETDTDTQVNKTVNLEKTTTYWEYSETTESDTTISYKVSNSTLKPDFYKIESVETDSDGTVISSGVRITNSFDPDTVSIDQQYNDEGDPTTETLSFDTINQRMVTYSGDTKNISMVKHNGATDMISDVVNVHGQSLFNKNIFDDANSGNEISGSSLINDMITVYNKILAEDVDWLNSDGVTLSNAAHHSITLAQTTVGARMQLYDKVSTMLTTQGDAITEDITNVSGVDVAELATRLMEMTTLYNMSLSIGGRILPQSLADYL